MTLKNNRDLITSLNQGIRDLYNELKIIEQTGQTKLQIRKMILKKVKRDEKETNNR
jgi:hypothetical protein